MRLVLMSDSHQQHHLCPVPDGDVFVHAGDFTYRGREQEVRHFARFLAGLPHRHKIVIAGNHDMTFESHPELARSWLGGTCTYLQDSGVEIDGVRFWGSPWQPWFLDWAFNLQRGPALQAIWAKAPTDTDVLITHGPPRGILDRVHDGRDEGDDDLLAAIVRIQPKLHVFGHIHEAAGQLRRGDTLFVNASILDERYDLANPCVVVDL